MANLSDAPGSSDDGVARYAWIAAAVTLLVFLPSLAAGFVYDDLSLIVDNPYAQSLEHLLRGFKTHLWDVYSYGSAGFGLRYYRPIVSASYVLNWVLLGHGAWSFHLVNVLAHVAATFLAVRVASRWTRSAGLGLLTGLLFGLHPSRTESVIWISGRTDVFMVLFALLAVELAWAGARSTGARAKGLFAASVVALSFSILSKEAGALTALLLLPDALESARGSPERRRLVAAVSAFSVLGVAYVGLRSIFYPVTIRSHFELTPLYGLFTVWAYLERIVFPWPQTFFYRPVEAVDGRPYFPPSILVLGALAIVGYGALLVRTWRKDRVAFVLLAAAIAFLGPLLNFSYTRIYVTTSDHFLYLPLFLFVAGLFRAYRERLLSIVDERASKLALAGVLAVYGAVDAIRVVDYRGQDELFRHEVELNPDNPVALTEESALAARRGDLETALALVTKATSPASSRFFLLAGEPRARANRRARVLALEAALTADGDVARLESIFAELDTIVRKTRAPEDDSPLDDAGVLRTMRTNAGLATMGAETALIGTRLGHTARAAELASAVSNEVFWLLPNPMNVVLTEARVGNFARARALLRMAEHPPSADRYEVTAAHVRELKERLDRTEPLLRRAQGEPELRARLDTAEALAELGAFLPALRVLRPLIEQGAAAPGLGPLYVELLLSARLRQEAVAVASRELGPERGKAAVEAMEKQLSPRILALTPPPEPAPWWQGSTEGAHSSVPEASR